MAYFFLLPHIFFCFFLCFSLGSSLLLTKPSLAPTIFKVKFHLNRAVMVNSLTILTNSVDSRVSVSKKITKN